MRKICTTILLVCAMVICGAQELSAETVKRSADETVYRPRVFGVIKARHEVSLYDGMQRFNVRGARFGVTGNASKELEYMLQADFSNSGRFMVLDAFVTYKYQNLKFFLGQQHIRLSTDLIRAPHTLWFANRSLLAKFACDYPTEAGENRLGNIGSRDLGAYVEYGLNALPVPVHFTVGVMNGHGINNPVWSNSVNFNAKINVGWSKGLSGSAGFYSGRDLKNPTTLGGVTSTDVTIWSGEMRYYGENFAVESELLQRRANTNGGLDINNAALIQGYFRFQTRTELLNYVAPTLRWDALQGLDYMNSLGQVSRVSLHRATVGVNLGFVKKFIGAEVRFNFEKYFRTRYVADLNRNPLFQDKFTIEIVASF